MVKTIETTHDKSDIIIQLLNAQKARQFREEYLDLHVYEQAQIFTDLTEKQRARLYRYLTAEEVGDMFDAIEEGKFREDLYYRLSTVDIALPPLRERKDDIHLLFRKFAADFAQKYKMPAIKLEDNAVDLLLKYRWSGNVRQLRNIAEQISVLETNRVITHAVLNSYLPQEGTNLPALVKDKKAASDFSNEREILYKVLFDMKSDLNDLKKLTLELMQSGSSKVQESNKNLIQKLYGQKEDTEIAFEEPQVGVIPNQLNSHQEEFMDEEEDEDDYLFAETVEEEETLRLDAKEIELIKKALDRNKGKRKTAADELGISERTLYRKIKQFDL